MENKPDEAAVTHEVSNDSGVQKKRGIMNTLYPPGPKPGAGGRIKNHCRRFWWCDLLVLAVIVLVIVLPIIFVGIPNKAQHDLDKSTLEVTAQEVTSPTPDSLKLRLVSVAKSSSQFHPKIRAFRAALSLEGKEPFLHIDVPEVKAEAETEIIIDEALKIEDLERFTEYTMTVMGSEEFTVHMDGETKIKQSGLQEIDVDYNKVVKMKGLNKLEGLNIFDLKILSGKNEILADGSNMVGKVFIPNPSVMTLELGNVTMNLQVDGKAVGTSLLPNLRLAPGNNTVPMQSKIDQLGIITLIKNKFKNGVIPLEIVGNSSIVEGGQHLTYYEKAIQNNVIKVDLDAGPALKGIGIDIGSFQ
ncbi:uncharacterized protein EI97DRAFT_24292 [Westerdykella ornata]|uniref:Uncharacterized protein n=1 Tax=Westerdykella ornata TaxID=318751 RepID=A0A6A6JXA2_WESOR|nr:uncharacterized protein EI97DRAFT_24292 [Westerdykella ornata]KAF2281251.1 hypothetical protein EI97DRAFT_24292 [Westerdykella ornata]